uniref:WSC domain-containing protein n=1 Tax=Macrostomum lignano TaxID=282301 RepID=A0A1I8JAG1_9PLAT
MSSIGPYAVAAKGVNRADMTLQLCSQICELGNFKYFGAQYSSHCFCGNSYGSQGGAPVSDCNMNCAGNAGQICGSGSRNSVYQNFYPRPIGNKFVETPRVYLNPTSSGGPFYSTLQPARSLIDCLLGCDASCQAVLFHLGTCYLLKLPALPQELVGFDGGKFVVRG